MSIFALWPVVFYKNVLVVSNMSYFSKAYFSYFYKSYLSTINSPTRFARRGIIKPRIIFHLFKGRRWKCDMKQLFKRRAVDNIVSDKRQQIWRQREERAQTRAHNIEQTILNRCRFGWRCNVEVFCWRHPTSRGMIVVHFGALGIVLFVLQKMNDAI